MPKVVEGVPIVEANRFSKFVSHPSELYGWLETFKKDDIPAVIVFTDFGYALYRTGMEDILDPLD